MIDQDQPDPLDDFTLDDFAALAREREADRLEADAALSELDRQPDERPAWIRFERLAVEGVA